MLSASPVFFFSSYEISFYLKLKTNLRSVLPLLVRPRLYSSARCRKVLWPLLCYSPWSWSPLCSGSWHIETESIPRPPLVRALSSRQSLQHLHKRNHLWNEVAFDCNLWTSYWCGYSSFLSCLLCRSCSSVPTFAVLLPCLHDTIRQASVHWSSKTTLQLAKS